MDFSGSYYWLNVWRLFLTNSGLYVKFSGVQLSTEGATSVVSTVPLSTSSRSSNDPSSVPHYIIHWIAQSAGHIFNWIHFSLSLSIYIHVCLRLSASGVRPCCTGSEVKQDKYIHGHTQVLWSYLLLLFSWLTNCVRETLVETWFDSTRGGKKLFPTAGRLEDFSR